MPALAFDLGHVADKHIVELDPGILFEVLDIRHLCLDGVGPWADTHSARQRKRVCAAEAPKGAAAGHRSHGQRDQKHRAAAAPVAASAHCPPPKLWLSKLPGNIIE